MYKLHAFATPNSIKPVIALEERGLDYELQAVNVRKGEQKSPQFVELNPNAKVSVLTVMDACQAMSLTESAAILVYLVRHRVAASGGATRHRTRRSPDTRRRRLSTGTLSLIETLHNH